MTDRAEINAKIATYTGNVRIASKNIAAFTLLTIHAKPEDIKELEEMRLKVVIKESKLVDAILKLRKRLRAAAVRGPRDDASSAWNAMCEALSAGARLPGAHGKQCAALLAQILPQGTQFAREEAPAAWGEGNRTLQRIDEDEIAETLDELIGPKFLPTIRAAHRKLGEALGLHGRGEPLPSKTAVLDANSDFSVALSGYTRALAANVELDDPKSVARFFAAVAPIDLMRSTRTTDEEDEEEEENEPGAPSEPTPSEPANG